MVYFPVAPSVFSGGYWEVSLPEHILWMMVSMTNTTTPNRTNNFKVTQSIDMSADSPSQQLESICSTTVVTEGQFLGIFDGQEFTIKIRLSDIKTTDYFGLFGFVGSGAVTAASVTNLNVEYTGSTFSYNYTPGTGPSYFGSLVGYCNRATISGCTVTYLNNIVITHSTATTTFITYTGGLCGLVANGSTLRNSSIIFNDTAELYCDVGNNNIERSVGGICGYIGQFSQTVNNLLNCSLNVSKNTTIGSRINVRNVGGITGAAYGGINIDSCLIKETDSSTGGTFKLQSSSGIPFNNSLGSLGGLVGDANFRTSTSSITNSSITLNNYTFSISTNTSTTTFYVGSLVALCEAVAVNNGRINLSNLKLQANNILLTTSTTGSSSEDYRVGGQIGQIVGSCNISLCSVECLNNYTVTITTGTSVNAPNCFYGGIAAIMRMDTLPTLPDYTVETYRIISNCNLIINGITSISLVENAAGGVGTNDTIVGGLFGQIVAGRQPTLNLAAIPYVVKDCNMTCNNNVLLEARHTNGGTPTPVAGMYVAGIIGYSRGCIMSNCDIILGSNNNTITITGVSKTHASIFVSCGCGLLTTSAITNVSSQAVSTVTNCSVQINGNVIIDSKPTGTPTTSLIGGLVGRISNSSSCNTSTISIIGTLTATAEALTDNIYVGGLVGDIASATTATIDSILSGCTGTITGNTVLTAGLNQNVRGIIGGVIGRMSVRSKSEKNIDTNTTMNYNGNLTMTSTNTTGGTRFIGGIVGLAFDSSTPPRISINDTDVNVLGTTTMSLSSNTDNVAGGLFGRLDSSGTRCSGCDGVFNSLIINNTGTTAGSKFNGGLCGNVTNGAQITNSTITVNSTTTLFISNNLTTGNTSCGVLFGLVQDAVSDLGTSATSCTGTFKNIVTINVNNTSTGTTYMGGIVAFNTRSIVTANRLNLNSLIIDNISNTNTTCVAGIIAGQSETPISGNAAATNDSIVNITGTALLDTNSTSSVSVVGVLGGSIDSQFKNNIINGENCIFTLNSSSTADATFSGGLIGLLTNTQTTQSVDVSNNILKAKSLNLTTSSPIVGSESSYIAGVIGRINSSNITVNNNQVLVYDTTSLINSNANQTNNMALLFAGIEGGTNTVTNNIFLTVNGITIIGSNSPQPTVIRINSVTASNTSSTTPTNNFAYICAISPNTLLNFQSYPPNDANGLTIYGVNYPITSRFTESSNLYYIDVLPAITIYIGCIPRPPPPPAITCCTANICNKNPQAANYSNEVIVNRKGGQAMIANIDERYASQKTNTARINVTPIFSSYQQYMTYLQSKNAR
jgi:hypothetical protein